MNKLKIYNMQNNISKYIINSLWKNNELGKQINYLNFDEDNYTKYFYNKILLKA